MDLIDIQTLACGAYGWFQQALIRLCVCAAVALFVVLVLRTQAVRDMAAVLPSYADTCIAAFNAETGGVPPNAEIVI